jgi:pyrroloquinoline quinone (PQQ) biosynthesis protein C
MKLRLKFPRRVDDLGTDHAATATTEWFWCELELLAQQWDPLAHRFYADWTRGQLRVAELASYAEEFDHLVAALEVGWCHAARKAGPGIDSLAIAHAAEEASRLELWHAFSRATGWDLAADYWYGADSHLSTRACAGLWSGDATRPLTVDLLTLYVIETTQRAVSLALLDGLRCHYHLTEVATAYFRVQIRDSRAHAAVTRTALESRYDSADPFKLLEHARAVHRAYWEMLDTIAAPRAS